MMALKVGLGWSLGIAFVALWAEIASLLLSKHRPGIRSRFWNLTFLLALAMPLSFWLPAPQGSPGDPTGAMFIVIARNSAALVDRTPVSVPFLVFSIWGVIAFIQTVRLARGLHQLAELTRAARPLAASEDGDFPILESPRVSTPSASFLGNAVLVPPTFTELPEYWREAVIAHETIHLRRRHGHAIVLEELVAALFWFHPLMKRLIFRVRSAREEAVDAETVDALGQHAEYRNLLVALATGSRSLSPAMSAADTLCARLQSLKSLENRVMPNLPFARVLCAGLSMLGVTVSAYAIIASAAPVVAQKKDDDKKIPVVERVKVGNVNPIYPEEFKQKKVEGLVLLEIVIDREGSVTGVSPVKTERTSRTDPAFVKASIEAVRQWKYQPADTTTKMTIAVSFRPK